MADTTTTNYGFTKPEINASIDTWGNKWNVNADDIDTELQNLQDTKITSASFSVAVQTFTASGTYTPTAGMKYCIIEAVGGGGSGGDVATNAGYALTGGGGGSGGYSRKLATASQIGASKTVTIGAGGGAGSTPLGAAGGATSVGTLCIANGGAGGYASLNGANVPLGGVGATAGTGDIVAAGNPGEQGGYVTTPYGGDILGGGGRGGSSYFGGGAQIPPVGQTGAEAGVAAGNYGSGGSGAVSNQAGGYNGIGVGSDGFVIITEFVFTTA